MEQDVLRLDVPMDHALRVRVLQGRGGVPGDADRLLDRKQLLAVEPLAQGFARDVGHHVEQEPLRFARVVQRQDVGVIQLGGNLDLAEKPVGPDGGRQLGPEHLHRDLAAVLQVVGEIDRCHAAAPELLLDGVAAGEGGVEALELPGPHGRLSSSPVTRQSPGPQRTADSCARGAPRTPSRLHSSLLGVR